MASLFGKKGSDGGTDKQQVIKQYLNKELSLNIKKLQRDHISSASTIRSGETVNRICSCLEAIFLHELKDSYSSKTFWPFITKFTHRDVVDQIKQLLFIRTEIGQCRAWVRMAVNDCLMDSYFSSFLREPSTLKQYYKPGAFLRDSELPLIADNYLQGLTVFTFQLSCNSSVLNMWDTALLLLSGAYLNSENAQQSAVVRDKETKESPLDSTTPQDDTSHHLDLPSGDVRTSSFHEAQIGDSLLKVDEDASHSALRDEDRKDEQRIDELRRDGERRDEERRGEERRDEERRDEERRDEERRNEERRCEERSKEGDVFSSKVTENKVQVEELEDSIVIHIESQKNADENLRTADPMVSLIQDEISEQPLFSTEIVSDVSNPMRSDCQEEDSLDPSNPFMSGYLEQDEDPLVFSRRKAKKKKAKRSSKDERNPPPREEEQVTEEPKNMVGMSDEAVPGNLADEEMEQAEAEGRSGEDDIYRFESRSSLRKHLTPENKVEWIEAIRESSRFKTRVPVVIPEMEGEAEQDEEFEKVDFSKEEELESKGVDVRVEAEREISGGNLSGSLGNGLTGMQGWSSDFDRMASPEPQSDPENQESGSSMVGHHIDDSAEIIKGLESSQRSEGHQTTRSDKETEAQTTVKPRDEIEDYEVIPITNGPLSKYADDRTQALLDSVTKIGREKGLAAQKFQCRGCSCELGIIFGKHKVCNYDGYYYCSECHLDEQAVIPARILHNWDFRKHFVARHTKLFLNQVEDMALIDVDKCNPSLYVAISEMEQILVLRKQILYLKAYLFTCKQSVAEELRTKIWPREYMLENCHLYSVRDLLQVQNGSLGPQLKKIIQFASRHVQQCALCSQKGFICEICENPKIIYPFDTDLTVRCDKCRSVFHKSCKTDIKPCPRCLRRKVRSPADNESDDHTQFPSPFT